jgi:hypothetical protein
MGMKSKYALFAITLLLDAPGALIGQTTPPSQTSGYVGSATHPAFQGGWCRSPRRRLGESQTRGVPDIRPVKSPR